MAFAKPELATIDKIVGGFCHARTDPALRDELRLDYSVDRHDIVIDEVRPDQVHPANEMRRPVAKLKFVRTADEWRLFWMRADLKWHRYEPFAPSRDLRKAVDVIDRDDRKCFFG